MKTPIKVNLIVLDRNYWVDIGGLTVKSKGTSVSWKIDRDYLDTPKSQFMPEAPLECDVGDIIIVKSELMAIEGFNPSGESFKPLFVGVVESIEANNSTTQPIINARDILTILNIDFPALPATGKDVHEHMRSMFVRYFGMDPAQLPGGIKLDDRPKEDPLISWSYQPSSPPTVTNLTAYFIGNFKKYGVVFDVTSVESSNKVVTVINGETGEEYQDVQYVTNINTGIKLNRASTLNIKNNVTDFANWDVYNAPAYQGSPNEITIYDKVYFDNMEAGGEIARYYIRNDGEIVPSSAGTSNVNTPTKATVGFIDSSEEEPATPLEVAQAGLSMSQYSHEISFDLNMDSKLIKFNDLAFGRLANIFYNNSVYASILTGFTLDSSSSWITLRFGNIRSTLQGLLDNQ